MFETSFITGAPVASGHKLPERQQMQVGTLASLRTSKTYLNG